MSKSVNLYSNLPYMETEFAEAWEEWVEYRKQRRKPYVSQMSVTKQLNMFIKNKLSVSQAIECIEHAIQLQWTGIFPLNCYKNGISSRTTVADSFNATDAAFANVQRNIDQAVRARWGSTGTD